MPYSLVAHNKAASTDTVAVSVNIGDTTGADLIACVVSGFNTTFDAGALSDNKGNNSGAWSLVSFVGTALNTQVQIFFIHTSLVGSGHIVTYNNDGGVTYPAMACAAFSGSKASSGDVHAENTAEPGATVALSLAQPAENNELCVTGIATGTISVIQSIDQGFTLLDTLDWSSGVNLGVGLAYKIQTTKQAETPTWTVNQSGDFAAAIQAFKAAAVTKRLIGSRTRPAAFVPGLAR